MAQNGNGKTNIAAAARLGPKEGGGGIGDPMLTRVYVSPSLFRSGHLIWMGQLEGGRENLFPFAEQKAIKVDLYRRLSVAEFSDDGEGEKIAPAQYVFLGKRTKERREGNFPFSLPLGSPSSIDPSQSLSSLSRRR